MNMKVVPFHESSYRLLYFFACDVFNYRRCSTIYILLNVGILRAYPMLVTTANVDHLGMLYQRFSSGS